MRRRLTPRIEHNVNYYDRYLPGRGGGRDRVAAVGARGSSPAHKREIPASLAMRYVR